MNVFLRSIKSNIIGKFLRLKNNVLYPNKLSITINKNVKLKFKTEHKIAKSWFFPRYGEKGKIHEPAVTKLICEEVTSSDCVFDIGSHLGFFTV